MASGTNYSQEYAQAEKAYLESNFALAAEIIDHLAEEFPQDPNVLLLRGHIYCYGFQNYELATKQYQSVLELSEEQDLLDFARSGIEQVEQLEQQSEQPELAFDESNFAQTEMLNIGSVEELDDSMGIDFPDEAFEAGLENNNFDLNQEYSDSSDRANLNEHDSLSEEQDFNYNPFDDADNSEDLALEDLALPDAEEPTDPNSEAELESDSLTSPSSVENQGGVHNSATFMVNTDEDDSLPDYTEEDFQVAEGGDYENDYDDSSELEIDTVLTEPFAMDESEDYGIEIEDNLEQESLDYQDELEFDEIDSSFFDLEELEQGLPDTGLFNVAEEPSNASLNISNDLVAEDSMVGVDEVAQSELGSASTTSIALDREEVQVDVKQGSLAGFINAPIQKKQFITAGVTGLVSAIAVLVIGTIGSTVINPSTEKPLEGAKNSLILSLIAGGSSFLTAAALGKVTAKHLTNASQDLQTQFDDVYQGNLNAKATVYSQDEFGQLANGFNRMTRVILTTTQEAQRRAEETEQAKEDLQRQVIRLLDDVEGAARGDLTPYRQPLLPTCWAQ